MKRVFHLVHGEARRRAMACVADAPDGHVVTVAEPTRNTDQSAKFHAQIGEIARAFRINGRRLDPETMKRLLETHPEINAVSILAAGVYGVCRAIMQLTPEKRPLVLAFDTVPTTVEMMKFGVIKATIYQHPYRQGHNAVNKAFEYLVNGRMPDKEADIMKNEIKLFENL